MSHATKSDDLLALYDIVVTVRHGRLFLRPGTADRYYAIRRNGDLGIDLTSGEVVQHTSQQAVYADSLIDFPLCNTLGDGPTVTITDRTCQLHDRQGGDYLIDIGTAKWRKGLFNRRQIHGVRMSPPPCSIAFVIAP